MRLVRTVTSPQWKCMCVCVYIHSFTLSTDISYCKCCAYFNLFFAMMKYLTENLQLIQFSPSERAQSEETWQSAQDAHHCLKRKQDLSKTILTGEREDFGPFLSCCLSTTELNKIKSEKNYCLSQLLLTYINKMFRNYYFELYCGIIDISYW